MFTLNIATDIDFEIPDTCETCLCYEVNCDILDNPDIDCRTRTIKTCSEKRLIVPIQSCAKMCDCCFEGKCLSFSNFDCFVLTHYQTVSYIVLLVFVFQIFSLSLLYEKYFLI